MRVGVWILYRCMENQAAVAVLSCSADVWVVELGEGLQVDCSLNCCVDMLS
jgi:hypothetical protein